MYLFYIFFIHYISKEINKRNKFLSSKTKREKEKQKEKQKEEEKINKLPVKKEIPGLL
tara:strand:+ start:702 stop:875 length:174 start_codon:yes stop_codon:yes gene_type:complete